MKPLDVYGFCNDGKGKIDIVESSDKIGQLNEGDTIEYWMGCLKRLHDNDIFAWLMISGKIKQLQRKKQNDIRLR